MENLPSLYVKTSLPKTPLEIREAVCRLEHTMVQAARTGEFQETEFPLNHVFKPGRYIRTIFLPKGTVVVGKIHKHAHPYTIWSGHVTVVTEGDGLEEIRGMYRGWSPAGVKRAIYVHEDTIWTVEHETDLTDLAQIEAAVIAKSFTELGWEDPVAVLQLTTATKEKL